MSSQNSKVDGQAKGLVICISGMAGTGKSTLARKIAEKYGLKYYSGGDALRALAAERGYDSFCNGWWESSGGLEFLEQRKNDPSFDKAVDDKLLEYASQGNVLLDSWTMPWLVKGGFKIWLSASVEKQAERISGRDNMTVDESLKALQEKEARTKAIYKRLYGFSLGEDLSPFDLILDTDNLTAAEVFNVLVMVIDNVVLGTRREAPGIAKCE
ncbi:MAG TPA: cytidylate kinase family protein [Candidatus Nanoarchaeia archaeon]|nr:cytidylate kinase family protein [Candidatus Nanoarchaeia archaeon]